MLDKKPAFSIYNVLLLLAAVFLMIAGVFLSLEWWQYTSTTSNIIG